jgi:hypothetical protein
MAVKAWGPLFALLAILAASLTGVALQYAQHHNQPKPAKSENWDSPNRKSIAIAAAEPDDAKAKDKQNREEGFKATDWLLVLFNGLLALYTWRLYLATRGLVEAASEQSKDMKASVAVAAKAANAADRSAKIAEDALFVAQRPYIFVTGAWFPQIVLDRDTFNYTGPEIWTWINFKLENHGRTAASIIEICADSACVVKLPAVPQYREQATYDTPRLIGADKEATVGYVFKTPIDGQVMNDIAIGNFMGGRRLYAFGYVKYKDIFDYTNTVGFCWYYNLANKCFLPADNDGYTYRKAEPPKPT